eukprot:12704699-Ditylum_brightwellii.AAC.1
MSQCQLDLCEADRKTTQCHNIDLGIRSGVAGGEVDKVQQKYQPQFRSTAAQETSGFRTDVRFQYLHTLHQNITLPQKTLQSGLPAAGG